MSAFVTGVFKYFNYCCRVIDGFLIPCFQNGLFDDYWSQTVISAWFPINTMHFLLSLEFACTVWNGVNYLDKRNIWVNKNYYVWWLMCVVAWGLKLFKVEPICLLSLGHCSFHCSQSSLISYVFTPWYDHHPAQSYHQNTCNGCLTAGWWFSLCSCP